ncbi:MAG: hypothetical protein QOI03_1071 [Solirubrobacteraceae bacterium]|nr:hypothetical protein [Solirubrobacteraceae bacterium]
MSGAAAGSGPWAVVHVPHSSAAVPEDVRATFALSDEMLQQELLRLTDRYTDEIFALDPAVAISVVFEVSRVVVDPERFLDDAIEPMASRGMGAVYTATTDGARLRVGLRETERDELLARFYEPHHEMLEAATENVLSATGRCLVIDGHSFPSEPLPSDLNQERPPSGLYRDRSFPYALKACLRGCGALSRSWPNCRDRPALRGSARARSMLPA